MKSFSSSLRKADDVPERDRRELENRVQNLEQQTRFTLDILEMATSLGDFQTSINKLHDPSRILRETLDRVDRCIPFRGACFYLVDEATADFSPHLCIPDDHAEYVKAEIANIIENGIFALAIREQRPIFVYSTDKRYRLVLHVLSTSSRVRGMFVGLLARGDKSPSSILLSLLTIILKNCANAIESFELYRLYRNRQTYTEGVTESLPLTVFELDKDGFIRFINAAVEEQLGYSKEKLLGRDARVLIPEDMSEHWNERLAECYEKSFSGVIEPVLIDAAGNRLQSRLHVRATQDENGSRRILGVVLEVSSLS